MKKSDLKVGYVVKMRNGKYRMVMNHSIGLILVGDGAWHKLSEHNEDLTITFHPFLDIIEVWGFSEVYSNSLSNDNSYRQLLWKRPETFLSDFKEKYPKAPLDEDGTPQRVCPHMLGYIEAEIRPCRFETHNCKDCWSRPLED